MKTELQAQQDFMEIEPIIKTLSQRINLMQYDSCEIEISGNKIVARLLETPRYKTIEHKFSQTGKYSRKVK